ncbi:MAG: AAA family ATPase [Firmicutes bacterium]|nr:AAA family ATPase [[Eubacterium] siraeum]MCM1487221.1 AAA family ATPase [Bacillota bacterium]
MIYLSSFSFPGRDDEFEFFRHQNMTCYTSFYPFQVLAEKGINTFDFSHVTIFYGGNGSGKTTALNVIGEALGLRRDSVYNRSSFFESYTALCGYELNTSLPENGRVITSDDVFDYILNIRSLNGNIDGKREELFKEYTEDKYSHFQLKSMEDYDKLKRVNQVRSNTKSKYVKNNLMNNVRERSNGENAYYYFFDRLKENGLYLLDEPENSLSPERQTDILEIIEDSAACLGCQFIISTHSPFLLSARGAKIYDLDEIPVSVKHWTELGNVRMYYDFFKRHENEFKNPKG